MDEYFQAENPDWEPHEFSRSLWYETTDRLRESLKQAYFKPQRRNILRVGLFLLDRMNPSLPDNIRERTCWPSHRRISSELGIGLATVNRALARLKQDGFIVLERKGWYRTDERGVRSGHANAYSFPFLDENYYGED